MANIFSTNIMYCSYNTPMMNFSSFKFTPMINFNYGNYGTIFPMQIFGNSTSSNRYNEVNIFGKRIHKSPQKLSTHRGSSVQFNTKINKPAIQNITKQVQKTDLRNEFIKTSRKYLGFNEADGSSKMISKSGEWCADFIKYVINESYRNKGLTPPTSDLRIERGMPHLRVENIKQWGIKHNTYLPVAGKSNKVQTITKNVKAGDVFILRENASHTGFVAKVYKDGSFDSIEGNRNDKVTTHHYKANDPSLSGFVQVRS